ncbi:adenylyl-sulfate kinase [Halobacillus naozhouensis]|uniref:Adenylyl-sulfate kinase n=1 Tax=Halobacillus naozhouensis TaxID=554880 RepID=A0ABY8IYV4_9BACI|nr:adenylyl-sulfate kinase [Halobacillus naozhouensis]WFT75419.1 adenylyl-sulfate kinase [Halobacillus naozhouensis]
MNTNIARHDTASISKIDYHRKNQHFSGVVWLTGLSGSGKSTIAKLINQKLYDQGVQTYVLDEDDVRHGLNNDLGYGERDRQENIRRVGEAVKLLVDSGTIVMAAFTSPFRSDRNQIRHKFRENEFLEVFVSCPIEDCEKRDPKGLYKKVRIGEIPSFTGFDSPYEPPHEGDLVVHTDQESEESSSERIFHLLRQKQWI